MKLVMGDIFKGEGKTWLAISVDEPTESVLGQCGDEFHVFFFHQIEAA